LSEISGRTISGISSLSSIGSVRTPTPRATRTCHSPTATPPSVSALHSMAYAVGTALKIARRISRKKFFFIGIDRVAGLRQKKPMLLYRNLPLPAVLNCKRGKRRGKREKPDFISGDEVAGRAGYQDISIKASVV